MPLIKPFMAIRYRNHSSLENRLESRIIPEALLNIKVEIGMKLLTKDKTMTVANSLTLLHLQVYLCSRRGAWIVPRTSFWGLPADMLANSRVVFTLPYRLLDWFVQVQANFRVDHEAYGLKPQHG